MIQTQTYSQRDPRWKNRKLGFSRTSTIGSDGCLLTDISNMLPVFGYDDNPAQVNEALKSVKAFSGGLIIWSRVSKAYPNMKFIKLANSYNNSEVAWYVYIKKVPVIVKVNIKLNSKQILGHWVLFIGDRKMVDPYDGKIKTTSTYPLLKYALYDK